MGRSSSSVTLLYDGDCGFCRRQAQLVRRLFGPRVTLVSTTAPGTLERYRISAEAAAREMYVQEADGRRWGGAAAVARLARLVPVIGLLGWLYYAPGARQLADALYRWIGGHRYLKSRWLGWEECTDACSLPAGKL